MTQEDIKTSWANSGKNRHLITSALIFLRQKNWDEITHIVSFSAKDRKQQANDYIAIRDSKLIRRGPYNHPYFVVRSDVELMTVRLLISEMNAWDFRTTKKVIQ